MRILTTLILSFITGNLLGQIPEFESNVSKEKAEKSIIHQEFFEDYSTLIAFSQHSYWFKRQDYDILVFDGKNWNLIKWSFEFNKKEQPKRIRKKTYRLNQDEANNFLEYIDMMEFYSFVQDSLDLNRIDYGDGTGAFQSIMDGTTDKFEIFTTNGFRISTAHEAVRRQEFVATQQRAKFIKCRNRFMDYINKNSR